MKRTTSKSSSKSSSKKVKYIFNPKSNTIMNDEGIEYIFDTKSNIFFEDNFSKNSKFKIIFDKNEPFYKHTQEK
jgi:hypothetical protein